jgi:hypothetical protein
MQKTSVFSDFYCLPNKLPLMGSSPENEFSVAAFLILFLPYQVRATVGYLGKRVIRGKRSNRCSRQVRFDVKGVVSQRLICPRPRTVAPSCWPP